MQYPRRRAHKLFGQPIDNFCSCKQYIMFSFFQIRASLQSKRKTYCTTNCGQCRLEAFMSLRCSPRPWKSIFPQTSDHTIAAPPAPHPNLSPPAQENASLLPSATKQRNEGKVTANPPIRQLPQQNGAHRCGKFERPTPLKVLHDLATAIVRCKEPWRTPASTGFAVLRHLSASPCVLSLGNFMMCGD